MRCRLPLVVLVVRVGSLCAEQLRYLQVAVLRRSQQQGVAMVVRLVDMELLALDGLVVRGAVRVRGSSRGSSRRSAMLFVRP